MSTPFGELKNAQGERLDYACQPAAGPQPGERLVVIGHGVTANKDRAWATTLADALEAAGYANLRFSFAGNGDSEGDFRESTITKEVADLGAVLDAVGERPIVYVGHSMGGAVGPLRAAGDGRIGLLISLAGMVDTAQFYQRKFGEQTPGQDVMWDKPECPLSQAFKDDLEQVVGSTLPQAKQVEVPWLLVHGTADTVVPLVDSEQVAAANPRAELVPLDGADHLFSGDHEVAMARIVTDWLTRQLAGDDAGAVPGTAAG